MAKPAKSVRVRHPLRPKSRLGPNDGRNGFTDDEGEEQAPAWETRRNLSGYSQRVSFPSTLLLVMMRRLAVVVVVVVV